MNTKDFLQILILSLSKYLPFEKEILKDLNFLYRSRYPLELSSLYFIVKQRFVDSVHVLVYALPRALGECKT